mgnify:CR=1 FL=1
MEEVIFFSNNKNKVIEIKNLLNISKIKILDLSNFSPTLSPKEIGCSFEQNAKIKSLYGFNKFNQVCFADDSGICIDALSGKPGIDSKNYLKNKNQNDVFNFIINEAKNKKKFKAFFQTTICLSQNKSNHTFFTGKVHGEISTKITGNNGFGYDPIFIPSGYKKTFAEMSIKEKNNISHRGIALLKLKNYFEINLFS